MTLMGEPAQRLLVRNDHGAGTDRHRRAPGPRVRVLADLRGRRGQVHGTETAEMPGYALIHADLSHLIINGVWLLAFCSPLARRFGTLRFIAFMASP